MLDRFLEALTGRRLGGALFVMCGLIVALAVLTLPGDDDSDGTKTPKIAATRLVSVPQLGLTFAHPRAWRRTVAGSVIRLRSPDGAAVMTFASPLEGRQSKPVSSALEQALLKRFAPAKVVREGPARMGLHPVRSFELRGGSRDKNAARALVLVAETRYRTYAVTLLTPARPSARRLAEAEKILATVRLTVPVRVPARKR